MDFKDELIRLVELVKNRAKAEQKRLTQEDIAKRLGYERSYFSTLLGKRGNVDENHIKQFKSEFKKELEEVSPVASTSKELVQAANIRMLIEEVAKLRAKVYGQTFQQAYLDMQENTTSIIANTLKGSGPEKQ